MTLKNELRKSLERLTHYETLASKAVDALEADPMNEELEATFDTFYQLEFNEYVYCIHLLTDFAGIDENTAKLMIKTKREELMNITA